MTTQTLPPWRGNQIPAQKRPHADIVDPAPAFPPGTPWRPDFSTEGGDDEAMRWMRGATCEQRRVLCEWGQRVLDATGLIGWPDQSQPAPPREPLTPEMARRLKEIRAARKQEDERLTNTRWSQQRVNAQRQWNAVRQAKIAAAPTSSDLIAKRISLGLTQRAAAKKVDLARGALAMLESDTRKSPETRVRVWLEYQAMEPT